MPPVGRDFTTLSIERFDGGWAMISFLVPGHRQNVITQEVLRDLAEALDLFESGPQPRGILLRSARAESFFAGADINRLDDLRLRTREEIEGLCDIGRRLFARLSELPWPSVAIIDGACLGGGLEMALACDLRLATREPRTVLGFPEVKLGLLPGWGGTVRLPRLIGPGPAVELIATGDSIEGESAARLGLVDGCVAADAALPSAIRLLETHVQTHAHLARRRRLMRAVELDEAERAFLESTTAAVILGRSGGHYPAPPLILETILAGCSSDAAEAARLESAAFATLAMSPVSTELVRLFRLGEWNRRDIGIDGTRDGEEPAIHVERPAVVGAGIMGAGIAASHLRNGFSLTLVDVQAEALAAAVPMILDEAAWDRQARRTDPSRAVELAGRLRTATSLPALGDADLVIESVVERTDVKRQVLTAIEQAVGPATVIATNTSTNPITKLATALEDPSRFCGIHFFNPVRRMTLVEVVRGPATSDRTIMIAVAHAKRLGKCPIVVRDSPGFLVNRLLMPYLHESVEMLREGTAPKRIDRVARSFGMPMGPLELYDMIGLDTALYAGLVMDEAFGDRIEASPVIPALVRAGRLGRKSGAGFYDHVPAGIRSPAAVDSPRRGRQRGNDATVSALIADYALPARETSDAVIANRLLLPVVLEATRVLDEGIVRDVRDIDLAVIHALGFPAFRGGVLAWADSIGAAEIIRRLEPLADLGIRMLPTPRLAEMARSGATFASLVRVPGASRRSPLTDSR